MLLKIPYDILVLYRIDLFLDEFKSRKENRVHNTTSSHRYPKSTVHSLIEELDFRRLFDFLSFAMREAISLVDALRGINRVDQCPTRNAT